MLQAKPHSYLLSSSTKVSAPGCWAICCWGGWLVYTCCPTTVAGTAGAIVSEVVQCNEPYHIIPVTVSFVGSLDDGMKLPSLGRGGAG